MSRSARRSCSSVRCRISTWRASVFPGRRRFRIRRSTPCRSRPNRLPRRSTSSSRSRCPKRRAAPLVDLLGSPHWTFVATRRASDAVVDAPAVAASRRAASRDQVSRRVGPAAGARSRVRSPRSSRVARRLRQKAQPALRAAAAAAAEIRAAPSRRRPPPRRFDAPGGLHQAARTTCRPATTPGLARRTSAPRGAILGALAALADAHAAHDDEPLLVTELANTVRRWIEGQTFSPRTGTEGLTLLDARAAAYADVDELRLVGLVESDWPERARRSIFYPASLLGQLGWPNEIDRLTAARARFHDLLRLRAAPRLGLHLHARRRRDRRAVAVRRRGRSVRPRAAMRVRDAGRPGLRAGSAPRGAAASADAVHGVAPALAIGWPVRSRSAVADSGSTRSFHGDAGAARTRRRMPSAMSSATSTVRSSTSRATCSASTRSATKTRA